MKSAGVRILVHLGGPEVYPNMVRSLDQQDLKLDVYSPIGGYNQGWVDAAGDLANGTIVYPAFAMFAGEDAGVLPAVADFDSWLKRIDAGFAPDTFALYGWLSCQLFAKAAADAGPKLTRAALLAQLAKVTSFDGGGLVAPGNPAAKEPPSCYLMTKVVNKRFVRLDTPAPGYRCDGGFVRL
jgi:hypothetical protein